MSTVDVTSDYVLAAGQTASFVGEDGFLLDGGGARPAPALTSHGVITVTTAGPDITTGVRVGSASSYDLSYFRNASDGLMEVDGTSPDSQVYGFYAASGSSDFYNDAQRPYGKRGYILDGLGITYRDRYLREGEQVVLDDDLLLHLTKQVLLTAASPPNAEILPSS